MENKAYENLIFEERDNVAMIILNRPQKLNALNTEVLKELEAVINKIKVEGSTRAIVITGGGEKAFAAGADIGEINKLDSLKAKKFSEYGQKVFSMLEECGIPVIAAVNGYALGGGCELALACHIRLASETAKFGQPEVKLGLIPGYGGTQRLARLIGTGRGIELLLTGETIDAQEALRIGLVNRIYQKDELLIRANELAIMIASQPREAVALILQSVLMINKCGLKAGLEFEAGSFGVCCSTNDFKEGTAAFMEKRNPKFTHS
ncbi:MAG TPA: enoyl-CoA hydratase-related protein [Ignavibacteriaceae bacterium]|nr:enoyl-CoA hydratase-related protein [Ignavibacteriaceae bacterium]